MTNKICSECGTEQNEDFKYCENCGTLLLKENLGDMKICPECGAKHNKSDKFCNTCGASFVDNTNYDVFKCDYCGVELTNEEYCPDCGKATGIKICPSCREISKNKDFCPTCGYKLNKNIKKCRGCGATIDLHADVCPECGAITQNKNPLLALVLSLIFPGLGQFYNNQNRKAITIIIGNVISVIFFLLLIGIVLAILIWIYAMYDAYTTAKALNNSEIVEDRIF